MEDKILKPQPTVMPKTFREYYNAIAHNEPYEGEPDDDFQARMQLFTTFQVEMTKAGLSVDDLAIAEMGLQPNNANPLLGALIARL